MTEILNSTKIIQLELDLRPLRARMDGDVVGPGDASWDEARLAWNLAVDQRPAAVALPESAEDVAAVVEFARDRRAARRTAGHRPQRRAAGRPLGHDPAQDRTGCAASRSTRTPASRASRPA